MNDINYLQVVPHPDNCDCCNKEVMSDSLELCFLERNLFFYLCKVCCDKAALSKCKCFIESDKSMAEAGFTVVRINDAGLCCKTCIDKAFPLDKQKEMHKARLKKNNAMSKKLQND